MPHTYTVVLWKTLSENERQDIVQKEEYKLYGQKNLDVEYMKYLQSLENGKKQKTIFDQ